VKPGDIFWVELPLGSGHEQSGRRPAIVLQDEEYATGLPLVIMVPMTGAIAASRFAGTLTIEPDETNGLRKTSVAMVFQVRAIDRRTIREQIGSLSDENVANIYDLLDSLTGRQRSTLTDEET
jgi:mRNA interferase MazF